MMFSLIVLGNSKVVRGKLKDRDSKSNRLWNIAHRGASGHAPEHTMSAYRLGKEMNSDYIEIDLQMTKDGVLIVMHDEKIDRTTTGSGYAKDLTLAEIKKLDAGSWFNRAYPEKAQSQYKGLQVLTLEEVIETFGQGSRYYIETKAPNIYPGMEKELVRLLKKHKLTNQNGKVVIQSFSQDSLLKMNKLAPEIPLVQLISYSKPAVITHDELVKIKGYAIGVGINYRKIDRNFVEQVQSHGLLIHLYTVNKREDMERLIEWGVNGLFTNYPDILEMVLKNK